MGQLKYVKDDVQADDRPGDPGRAGDRPAEPAGRPAGALATLADALDALMTDCGGAQTIRTGRAAASDTRHPSLPAWMPVAGRGWALGLALGGGHRKFRLLAVCAPDFDGLKHHILNGPIAAARLHAADLVDN